MQQKTINDLLIQYDFDITTLAKETGFSISLISKIKNNQIAISTKTHNRFEKRFQIDLINELTTYNKAYIELLEKYYIIQRELDKKSKKCQELKEKINNIKETLKNVYKEL